MHILRSQVINRRFSSKPRERIRVAAPRQPEAATSARCRSTLPTKSLAGNHSILRLPGAARLRAKSTISLPSDVYEQEANHTAERVINMTNPNFDSASHPQVKKGKLGRKCTCRSSSASGECDACSNQGGALPQHHATRETNRLPVPSVVHEVLRSPGLPLDLPSRSFMEPRFGHAVTAVRVHTDTKVARSAGALNALDYAVGRSVVFGREQYAPSTTAGRRLLAHELAYTVQQISHAFGLVNGLQRAPDSEAKKPVDPGTLGPALVDNRSDVWALGPKKGTVKPHAGDLAYVLCDPQCYQAATAPLKGPVGGSDAFFIRKGQYHHQVWAHHEAKTADPVYWGSINAKLNDSGAQPPKDNANQTPIPANLCGVTGSFDDIPSGDKIATVSGKRLSFRFGMSGSFQPVQAAYRDLLECSCSCGEYRQEVRGKFTRAGKCEPNCGDNYPPICGVATPDPTIFYEDCRPVGSSVVKYGYRSIPLNLSRFVDPDGTPNQATGCVFFGSDSPGIEGKSGEVLGMDLTFRGRLIDTCNGNKILDSSTWTVFGTGTIQ
jgi:Domain of unknown function (DUF4157)